jgi:phosphohistidine phosphatase
MKRLLLLRHAKTEPGNGRDDFERALTPSGEIDAARIGDFVASQGLAPQMVVYSGARRTRDTAEIVITRLGREVERHEENALYEATRHLILALLRQLPDKVESVMVVGHNPGMGDVANVLAGKGDKPNRLRLAAKYPTCGLAVLEFEGESWTNLAAHAARLEGFVTPADLGLRQQ